MTRGEWRPLSARTWLALSLTATFPVIALLATLFAPGVDRLASLFFGALAAIGLILLSIAEGIAGLIFRSRAFVFDGLLRLIVVALLATPCGRPLIALVPVGWSFAQSFDPAYACHQTSCPDAIVRTDTFGGEMLTPQCSIELIRVADRRDGRAAALRVLRASEPSLGTSVDDGAYAKAVSLLLLGRGFYRAVRCEDRD